MRIKEFPSVTTPSPDDVFVLDGSSGTRKISLDSLKTSLANSLGVGSGGSGSSTDFVTAQGTSGGWSYRKWNNGIKECWLSKSETDISFTLMYPYADDQQKGELIHQVRFTYPWGSSDGFSEIPTVMASVGITGDINGWMSYVGSSLTDCEAYIKTYHSKADVESEGLGNSKPRSYTVRFYAIGR